MLNTLGLIMLKKILKWYNLNIRFILYQIFLFFVKFEQFVEDNFGTLDIDSVANSRAISMGENEINTPDEISALFDSIAYGKVWE